MTLEFYELGLVEYADGLALQAAFQNAQRSAGGPDVLLSLEHPSVITLGRGAQRSDVLASTAVLEARGIEVVETDRGGEATFHGPGQRVLYPLLKLTGKRQDVRWYVGALERVVIETLATFGLRARGIEGRRGVWVGGDDGRPPRKIAAVGVHLSRWMTRHGVALNVSTHLEDFNLIVPCGITDAGVTSIEVELGRPVPMREVDAVLARTFETVFECSLAPRPVAINTVSVYVVAPDGRVLSLRRVPQRGGFEQPITGHLNPGEGLTTAAARELLEETGFTDAPRPLGYQHAFAWPGGEAPTVARETAFVLRLPEARSPRLSAEHSGFEWITREEARRRFPHPGLRGGLRYL